MGGIAGVITTLWTLLADTKLTRNWVPAGRAATQFHPPRESHEVAHVLLIPNAARRSLVSGLSRRGAGLTVAGSRARD